MPIVAQFPLADIKRDLRIAANLNQWLCLRGNQGWAGETNRTLRDCVASPFPDEFRHQVEFHVSDDDYLSLAGMMLNQEHARAADHASHIRHKHATYRFIYYYATYLDGEKKALLANNEPRPDYCAQSAKSKRFKDLLGSLREELAASDSDCDGGALRFLFGLVLSRMNREEEAIEQYIGAVKSMPLLWSAWQELSRLVSHGSKVSVSHLKDLLPHHWMRDLFLARTMAESMLLDEADLYVEALSQHGFENCPTLLSMKALCAQNRREHDSALAILSKVRKADPYRLDDVDTMSHLYFVMENKEALSKLAQEAIMIDKFNEKSCCAVGNYYSIRGEHEKAVEYFTRAVTINPFYSSVWTLIGHEYMELKNPQMAIKAYTYAVKANPKDYRGWYGLGQAYEIFKMPSYSIQFYMQAHAANPKDSRMLIALAEAYESVDRLDDARKVSEFVVKLSCSFFISSWNQDSGGVWAARF